MCFSLYLQSHQRFNFHLPQAFSSKCFFSQGTFWCFYGDRLSRVPCLILSLLDLMISKLGFPIGSVVENPSAVQETEEMQVWSLGQEGPLEKELATHSNILVWKIPWTEEPGRPKFLESQRVRHKEGTEDYGTMTQMLSKLPFPVFQFPINQHFVLENFSIRDYPDGLVALSSQCRGPRFDPCAGN